MKTQKEYIKLLKEYKKAHSAEYGITKMGIFGSVARNEQKEDSDIDVFVEADNVSLMDMGGIVYDLKELFGTDVDLVRNHKYLHPYFYEKIQKDVIYV